MADPKTILLVEDDEVIIHVYRAKFMREGFQVEVAGDGLAAMRTLHAIKPDVIVLDLMMPKLSGIDVLKYARSEARLKTVPIIILSNAYNNDMVREVRALGAQRGLVKSECTPNVLLVEINKVLSEPVLPPEPAEPIPPSSQSVY